MNLVMVYAREPLLLVNVTLHSRELSGHNLICGMNYLNKSSIIIKICIKGTQKYQLECDNRINRNKNEKFPVVHSCLS